jgi:hypothetical protein
MAKASMLFSSLGGNRDPKWTSPYAGKFGNTKGESDVGMPYVDQNMDVPNDSPYAGGFGTTNRGSGSAMGGSFNVPNVSKYADGGEVDDDYQCSDQEKLAAYELMDALGSGFGSADGDKAEKVARALKAFVMMCGG